MDQQKKSKFWLMRMRLSKILYSLQQRLVQNQAKLSEKTLVAKMSGIWQQSTQKTALTVKNADEKG